MTPKQFHITAAKAYHRFNVTYLTTAIRYTYSSSKKTVPECTYDMGIHCGGDLVYVNVCSEVRNNPHLTIQNGLDWLERMAKDHPEIIKQTNTK